MPSIFSCFFGCVCVTTVVCFTPSSVFAMDRFDRVVRVDVPDTAGREAILKVHTRNMKLEDPAFLIAVAEVTPGE